MRGRGGALGEVGLEHVLLEDADAAFVGCVVDDHHLGLGRGLRPALAARRPLGAVGGLADGGHALLRCLVVAVVALVVLVAFRGDLGLVAFRGDLGLVAVPGDLSLIVHQVGRCGHRLDRQEFRIAVLARGGSAQVIGRGMRVDALDDAIDRFGIGLDRFVIAGVGQVDDRVVGPMRHVVRHVMGNGTLVVGWGAMVGLLCFRLLRGGLAAFSGRVVVRVCHE